MQATNTAIQIVGSAGRAGAIPIEIDRNAIITASQAAELVKDVINSRNLPGVVLTQAGANILVEGAQGVAGTGVSQVNGIRDFAGNAMRATDLDGTTVTTIFLGEGLDYGDLPSPYIARRTNGGPSHIVVDGFTLGATITADADARLPNLDEDDGVTVGQLTAAYPGNISVNVRGASISRIAYVHAWVDFNGNGSFEDAGEKLAVLETFSNGNFNLPINIVPSGAITTSDVGVRVRLSTQSTLASVGAGGEGEVEDNFVRINRNPHQNPNNRYDVNNDTFVSAIDVLQVINYINSTGGGPLPINRAAPPYLDVDGDASVGPLDVLAIITFINSNLSPTGGEGLGLGDGEGEGAGTMWIQAPMTGESKDVDTDTSGLPSNALLDGSESSLGNFLANYDLLGDDLDEEIDWSLMGYESNKETDDFDLALGDVLEDLIR